MTISYIFYIPLILLAIFLLLGILYKKISSTISGYIGVFGLSFSTLLSYYAAYQYFFVFGKKDGVYQTFIEKFVWMNFSEKLHLDMGILIDPISIMMLLVITTISLLVHIYSIDYMKTDKSSAKFFAFLALFTFSMIGLVLATNLFQTYIFWELVGVSSFLLIGYYYTKPSAITAAKKAFIITRFADFGFLIGILILGNYTGTYDFETINNPEGTAIANLATTSFIGLSATTWGLLLIFIGCAGKSALFPLHIWLPDAMEGPTPVSALIHAATMVVAGVYLVARLFPMYYFVEDGFVLNIITYTGLFSSLFAAIIAVSQKDIKRILAFSTMSQIGFMMVALGVSGYGGHHGLGYMSAMFHLFTHAIFKALLFLCAGSVIHAVGNNYLNNMGNLRKYLPITNITFLVATLALSGIPPFAGFWSKDLVMEAILEKNKLIYSISLFTAGLTSFYMFRLYFGIFYAKENKYEQKPQESTFYMTRPIIFLAFLCIIAGFVPFGKFVSADKIGFEYHLNYTVSISAVLVSLVGIAMSYILYKKENNLPDKIADFFGIFYKWTNNKFYFDQLYLFITKKIIFDKIAAPISKFDKKYVDGTIVGIGNSIVFMSNKIKKIQSGRLQDYSMFFVSGVIIITFIFIYLLKN